MGEEELELRAVTVRTGEHANLSLRVAPPGPPPKIVQVTVLSPRMGGGRTWLDWPPANLGQESACSSAI